MNLDFLDKNLWQPIGKGASEVDRFVDREMPFDSGWGAPAAAVAAYFAAPYMMSAMGPSAAGIGGEGAAAGGSGVLGGGGEALGGGGFTEYLSSLFGGETGGAFTPTAGNSFELANSGNTAYLNQLAAQNGVSQGDPSWFDNLIGNNEQGLYDKFNATNPNGSPKSNFGQEFGKQLMQNKPGSSMGQNMPTSYNETPVQRQNNTPQFAPNAPIQPEKSDIAKLAALLRKKDQ